jgi:acetylornithine deacetylase/succinyl-diaminopimelate desuccinylase-like protein
VETIRAFGGRPEVYRPRRGSPVVHGVFDDSPSLPSVTVYNHLDVQPASRDDGVWRTDPFVLAREGDRYFGRGTTDDKGPALTALLGIRAAREAGLPVNLRVLWEFEEEVGSPAFEETVRRAARSLRTDSILVSDTVWLTRTQPACPTSLRGFQGFRLVLQTGEEDRHSGDVGGPGRNPIAELMEVVGRIIDARTGRVKVPGFYADVVPPTRRELEDFRRSGFSVRTYKKDFRLRSLRTEDPLEVMKRMWALPTFEVHGVAGGYAGPGLKAIVPGRAEVFASCRLVADQTPEKVRRLITAFVKKQNPDVEVHAEGGALPYRGLRPCASASAGPPSSSATAARSAPSSRWRSCCAARCCSWASPCPSTATTPPTRTSTGPRPPAASPPSPATSSWWRGWRHASRPALGNTNELSGIDSRGASGGCRGRR